MRIFKIGRLKTKSALLVAQRCFLDSLPICKPIDANKYDSYYYGIIVIVLHLFVLLLRFSASKMVVGGKNGDPMAFCFTCN